MNREIQSIIHRIENVNSGEPWFGRAVLVILEEADAKKVYTKSNNTEHSLIELLYHMITWADFTLKRIEKDKINDLAVAEELDWRIINLPTGQAGPKVHTWKKGLAEFKAIHKKIIALLHKGISKNPPSINQKKYF
ncbi:MAG: hypothetical protein LH619_00370 [Chitinophagaceae bacterium]|nr:hypothetical protein [Chitinophagaceae bacterium]